MVLKLLQVSNQTLGTREEVFAQYGPTSAKSKPRCPFISYQICSYAFILKTVLECTRAVKASHKLDRTAERAQYLHRGLLGVR